MGVSALDMAIGLWTSSTATRSNLVSAVVWEWQRDDGGFSPYPPQVSAKIESTNAMGSAFVSIGKWSVDLSRNVQIRGSTGTERSVRRTTCNLPSSPDLFGYWEWEVSRGRFVLYGIQAIVDIEKASVNGCVSVDLSTTDSCIPYLVDLENLTQTRHGYGTKRRVRRVSLSKPMQKLLCVSLKPTGLAASASSVAHLPGSSTYPLASPASSILRLTGGPITTYPSSTPASSMVRRTGGGSIATYSSATPVSSVAHVSSGGSSVTYPSPSPSPFASGTKTSKSSISGRRVRKSGHPSGSVGSSKAMPTSPGKGKSARKMLKKKGPKASANRPLADDCSLLGPLTRFVECFSALNLEDDGPCPICMNQLSESSGFEEDAGLTSPSTLSLNSSPSSSNDLYKLRLCGHLLHRPCLLMLVRNSSDKNGLSCPTCKKIHGVRTGDMPDGTMSVTYHSYSLPGHAGEGTIEISYNFTAGIHNGVRYRANGFPRTCYLPGSPKGRKVLRLLQIAWDRRLTFTIGTSVTTGAANTVVWNEIHHKTEATSNHTGHGYPDPHYLDNVLAELAAQGVENTDDEV